MAQSYDLNELKLIDRACMEFEQQWSSEADLTEAKLVQLIEQHSISSREQLLSELLMVSWSLQQTAGDLVEPTFYLQTFPSDAPVVNMAFDRFCREHKLSASGPHEFPCLPAGLELGPYVVQERIGRGGMGDVYSANDSRLGRSVAVKVLAGRLTADANFIKRFSREAAAIGKLSHPNIVTLYDLGEAQLDSGEIVYFVVMELLEGQNLREYLDMGPLTTQRAVCIARDIANALEAAHRKGVIHRDIKPDNIFITDDGRVKVLDFGLARLHESTRPFTLQARTETYSTIAHSKQLTGIGTVMGTSGYMAPEQVRGEPATAASDIFGLSCIVFEMLTGRQAFEGNSYADVASATLRDDPLSSMEPGDAEQSWFDPLRKLLQEGLGKDGALRLSSAAAFAQRLEPIAQQLGTASPNSLLARSRASQATTDHAAPQSRANMFRIALGIFMLAVLVTGVWISGMRWNSSRAPVPRDRPWDIAVLPFVSADKTATDTTAIGLTLTLTDDLARSEKLRVRPYSAVANLNAGAAGAQENQQLINLKVDRLITGRLSLRDGHHHLWVEIVDPHEQRLVWSGVYDCPANDLLKLQAKVRAEVFEHLGVTDLKSNGTRAQAVVAGELLTSDLVAFENYVRAKMDLDTRSELSVNRAVRSFRESIRLDPNFVEAHTGLAQCCIILAERALVPRNQALEMGLEAIERALELEPDNAEALVCRAMIRFEFQWEFDMAERDFARALQLAPHSPLVRHWYAELLSGTGKPDQAIAQIEVAQQLDPESSIIAAIAGRILFKAGRFEDAAASLESTLHRHPEFDRARGYLLEVYEQQERFADALELWRQITQGSHGYVKMRERFEKEGKSGYWAAQLEYLEDLRHSHPLSPIFDAVVYAQIGDEPHTDRALRIIEEEIAARSVALPANLTVHPGFSPLREQARFQELVRLAFGPQLGRSP